MAPRLLPTIRARIPVRYSATVWRTKETLIKLSCHPWQGSFDSAFPRCARECYAQDDSELGRGLIGIGKGTHPPGIRNWNSTLGNRLGCNFIMAPCREQFSLRVTAHRYGNRPGLIPGSYRCLGVDFLSVAESDEGLFRAHTGACRDSFLAARMRGWLAKSFSCWDLQRRVARPAHFVAACCRADCIAARSLGSVITSACNHLQQFSERNVLKSRYFWN